MAASERLKVAILDDYERAFGAHPALAKAQSAAEITVFDRPFGSVERAADALQPFDAICLIRERQPCPADLISALPRLRYLAFTGARNPSCDQAAAARQGIAVSNTPGGPSKASTAELTWALALAAGKRLTAAVSGLREGHWRADEQGRAYPLPDVFEGATLGLLGLGEIGQRVARFGHAFGMNVLAWSPNLTTQRAQAHGVTAVARDALFQHSDVLSVHLVLAEQTRGIVGQAELAQMKPGSILVNTSRAGLIDSAALVEVLAAQRNRLVALDVFDTEPIRPEDPLAALLNRPDAVLCPHLGYVNEPVFDAFAGGLGEVIESWVAGQPVRVVNQDLLK
ncbi:MAG: D-2-hydroxyacid dehydrogenase family protein [Burkholderiaceae bacterium]